MNPIWMVIWAYLALAAQVGLGPLLEIKTRFGFVQPQFILILAVVVGLSSTMSTTYLAWALFGLALDLIHSYVHAGGGSFVVIGPYAIGYLCGAYVLAQIRSMIVRQHPLAIPFTALIVGVAIHLVVVGVFTVRQWYDPRADFSPLNALLGSLLVLLYTSGVALLGIPWWGRVMSKFSRAPKIRPGRAATR